MTAAPPLPPPGTRLANLALLVAWAWLHLPLLSWAGASLLRRDGVLTPILGVGLAILVLRRVSFVALWRRLGAAPTWRPGALALVGLGLLGLLASRHWLPIHVLQGLSAGLGAYGLLGLFLDRERWRRAAPLLLLALGLMPVTAQLDLYLGFPARRLTAEAVALLLERLGVGSLGSGTVLVLESGTAFVDGPCSGVKSLWTGALFLLALPALSGRGVDRWLGLQAGVFVVAMAAANTTRVAALVLLHHVAGQPLLAELVHTPLGILGFGVACALAWLPGTLAPPWRALPPRPEPPAPPWLGLALAVPLLAGLGVKEPPPPPPSTPMALPAQATPLPLTDDELRMVAAYGSGVSKGELRVDGLEARLLLVRAGSWKAHHVPRVCLEAAGREVAPDRPLPLGEGVVRWAETLGVEGEGTAIWWFQAGQTLTDDHAFRIFDSLSHPRTWTLVSLLVEGRPAPDDPALLSLVRSLRAHVAAEPEPSP